MPKFQYVKSGDFEAPARFKTKGGEALSGLLRIIIADGHKILFVAQQMENDSLPFTEKLPYNSILMTRGGSLCHVGIRERMRHEKTLYRTICMPGRHDRLGCMFLEQQERGASIC